MTSFGDFLMNPKYSDLKFITDHKPQDLTENVASVDISEAPDVASYIPENVLLLTNAMFYENNQKGLITWINSLKKQKVIALGIKTSRFINKVNQEVIDHANNVNFPIFVVPKNYSLGDLLHQISNFVWDTEREEILFALDIQKRFSKLLFIQSSVNAIIQQLGSIINTPVVLLNPFLKPIATNHSLNKVDITEREIKKQLSQVLKKNGKKDQDFSLYTQNKNEFINVKVMLINHNVHYPSFLLILNPESMSYPISEFAIDQASLVIAFSLYRWQKEYETKDHIKRSHFFDMIHSIENGENISKKRTENESDYQIVYSSYYQIIRIDFKEQLSPNTSLHTGRMSVIGRWLENNIDTYFSDAITVQTESMKGFYVLIQHKPDNLSESLITMYQYIKSVIDIELLFSVGFPVKKIQRLDRTYRQAKLAYENRTTDEEQSIVKLYEESGPKHLFSSLDDKDTNFYCINILKDLAFPENEYLKDLRDTLNVYLSHQCEITATAANLYIHRNTVKYRIERCEEILGQKIDTPEHSFNLRLALALSKNKLESK